MSRKVPVRRGEPSTARMVGSSGIDYAARATLDLVELVRLIYRFTQSCSDVMSYVTCRVPSTPRYSPDHRVNNNILSKNIVTNILKIR